MRYSLAGLLPLLPAQAFAGDFSRLELGAGLAAADGGAVLPSSSAAIPPPPSPIACGVRRHADASIAQP
ncbi:MAG: hypothetical protein M5R42_09575 [Rhodocyclaceae bacterium]|nr:hypothetical protein [Rhodocyclaceae bacterium]